MITTMKTGSKVLLMTDFSQVAGYAAYYAKQFASKLNASIEVMHIISTPVDWVRLDKDKEKFYPQTLQEIASAKNKLSSLVHEFEQEGLEAFSNLIYSYGSETVFEHVNQASPDFVIMGSEGRGSKKPFFLGSTAQKIFRNIKIPTLIVKEEPARMEIKRIAFLSTLEPSQRPVFQQLKSLANMLGAELDVIFVNTPYDFYEQERSDELFQELCDGDTSIRQILINAENPENGILYYAERNQPDILALAKTDKSGFSKFFNPSLTENLVRVHNFPMLSICAE
jgi:nucleotide-binding universal stress UspA family protein